MAVFIHDDYVFPPKPEPVVKPGEFVFSAMHLDHNHLIGMTWGLVLAGGTLKSFYDPDPEHVKAFLNSFPHAHIAESEEEILNDPEVKLVAAAAVTCERADLGIRVMKSGKDYFTAKAPLSTLEQLARVRACHAETGRKYFCYYSERVDTESCLFADMLIKQGAIGKVLHMEGTGPHRLNPAIRPDWFWSKEQSGGLLCDIGSHQVDAYLHFCGETEADVVYSRTANYANPDHPSFEDFGDCMITGKNGTTFYFRVDWFTPDGVRSFGDGRTFIVGTKGSIELRKCVDAANPEKKRDIVILLDDAGEHRFEVEGKLGSRYFINLINDCIHRTETAQTMESCFKAAELCVKAAWNAVRIQ